MRYGYEVRAMFRCRGRSAGHVGGPYATRELAEERRSEAARRSAPGLRIVRVRVAADAAPCPTCAELDCWRVWHHTPEVRP